MNSLIDINILARILERAVREGALKPTRNRIEQHHRRDLIARGFLREAEDGCKATRAGRAWLRTWDGEDVDPAELVPESTDKPIANTNHEEHAAGDVSDDTASA